MRRSKQGTPQGGVISPLLANLYLHGFDWQFHQPKGPAEWAKAHLVRYADDFVVLARFVDHRITGWIERTIEGGLGLEINREKTRVANLKQEGETLDFLGYSYRFDRDLQGRPWCYLNLFPSRKALEREREKLRQKICPRVCFKPLPELIGEINVHLRGWSNYFGHGYPRDAFRQINHFVRDRLCGHLERRSQRPWRPPDGTTHYAQLAKLGLLYL
jgi:RNA-directed DNA polymerase